MVINKGLDDVVFDAVNTLIMLAVLIIVLYPLYFVVIASFSEPYEVASGNLTLLPKGFTLEAYENVFKNNEVWIGYRNTIFYTITGTFFSLFLTLPASYVLSRKGLPGRTLLNWYFLFTMYFSGGLIPTYILVKSVGFYNKPYTIIILGALSIHNMIITRSYYRTSIPEELYEAAEIDGASQIRVFLSVALPLSAPIIAVMALYYGVAQWNSFFKALVYVSERDYMPLQIVLRNILIYNQTAMRAIAEGLDSEELIAIQRQAYMAEAMKYSLIIIASFPLLIAYTFVQKYFIKGIMVGSLKA
jgi:putative aldouronate transport system permease protein